MSIDDIIRELKLEEGWYEDLKHFNDARNTHPDEIRKADPKWCDGVKHGLRIAIGILKERQRE